MYEMEEASLARSVELAEQAVALDPGYHEGSIVQNQYLSGPGIDPASVAGILGLAGIEGRVEHPAQPAVDLDCDLYRGGIGDFAGGARPRRTRAGPRSPAGAP